MADEFRIKLSSGEIYVLAGLLQYQAVIGIDDIVLFDWSNDINSHVRDTITRLEQKNLVLCELNKKVFVDPQIHKMIECMCAPNVVCIITGNLSAGRKGTRYILEKNGCYTVLEKQDTDAYQLALYSEQDFRIALSRALENIKQISFHEKMLLEDAEYIRAKIHAFETDAAVAHLRKCVSSEEAARMLLRLFSQTDRSIETRILIRRNSIYETVAHEMVFLDDQMAITISIDENNVLTFLDFDPQLFRKKIYDPYTLFTRKDSE